MKNTTFPMLKQLLDNIEPKELSGAKFTNIQDARNVAKKCQQSKVKLQSIEETADILGVEKAFYTKIKDLDVLFIINGEEASIEVLPAEYDILYNAYRPLSKTSTSWEWWAMGKDLSMMLNCLKKLGAKKFQFNSDFILGIEDDNTYYCLTNKSFPYKELDKYLPKLKPIKKDKT